MDFFCHGIIHQDSISFQLVTLQSLPIIFFLRLTEPCSLSDLAVGKQLFRIALIVHQSMKQPWCPLGFLLCSTFCRRQHSATPIIRTSRIYNYSKFDGITVKGVKFSNSREFLVTLFGFLNTPYFAKKQRPPLLSFSFYRYFGHLPRNRHTKDIRMSLSR